MIVNESGEITDRKLYNKFKKLLKGLKYETRKNYSDAIDQLKENIDRNGELEFSIGKYSYHIEPDYVEKYEVWKSKEGVDGCEVMRPLRR